MIHLTNLAPNTEYDDALLASALLLLPWHWKRGKASKNVEEEIARQMPTMRFFTFESGRTALTTLLQAAGIGAGDEVIVQAYTCVAVPDPVIWVGATPVYVDCDDSLTASVDEIRKRITPRTRAIVLQHTFGIPAHIEEISSLAREKGILLIEDCAHALGATYQNKPVGTCGDASFFSFGRDKVISSVFGGALAIKNQALGEKVASLQATMKHPPALWIAQQLLHPPLMWLGKKTYRYGGKGIVWIARTLITSKAVLPEEKIGGRPAFIGHRLPQALALLALFQLSKLDRFNAHRRVIAGIYQKELAALPMRRQTVTGDTQPVYLRYTMWCPESSALRSHCAKQGIYLGDWYDTPIAPRGVSYDRISYQPGSCPNAERIAEQTLNLPTDIHCSEKKARAICKILTTFYALSR